MTAAASARTERSSVPLLVLGALGVVYGDIGTSPLYAIKESLHAAAPVGIRRLPFTACCRSSSGLLRS